MESEIIEESREIQSVSDQIVVSERTRLFIQALVDVNNCWYRLTGADDNGAIFDMESPLNKSIVVVCNEISSLIMKSIRESIDNQSEIKEI